MSKDAIKAVLDNLTMGAGRRAEREWDQEFSLVAEPDSKETEARAAQPNTPLHVTDWAQAQREDPELEVDTDWCLSD